MINGIIKLFYSEIVKTKMGNMESGEYGIKNELKGFQEITLKIDSIFLKAVKILILAILTITSFYVNFNFGIGVLILSVLYLLYKGMLETKTKEYIEDMKRSLVNNSQIEYIKLIDEQIKSKLSILATFLVMGLLLEFNMIIIISFAVVLMFTIKDMYSKIR